jgi:histidine ammonia-lyase
LPVVPEHGGVGASGDLVQLAHVALAAIGEGEVRHQGRVRPTAEVFAENGIEPAPLRIREGLAMVNGTSAMTGIGLVTLLGARALFHWTLLAAALIQEILETYDDPFSPALSGLKAHPGQRRIAGRMTAILSDSRLIHRNGTASLPQNGGGSRDVQPSYSIRCIPQILGPILETLDCAEKIVVGELNSVSDNPAIDPDSGELLHGGNFHGDYVAHEMDKVKAAITKLSMLCERQLNHLLDDRLNGRLPPFVNLGRPGLDLGLQGAQFTATSTVAENQSLAMPVCVHSIPCNRDNQDIVSMGANAALLAKRVVDNSFQVLAIELVALLQAVDALEVQDRLATETRTLHRELREIVPVFREDTLTAADLRRLVDHLQVPRADHLTR